MKSLIIEFNIDEETFIPCNCPNCQAFNPLLDIVGVPESRELRCLLKIFANLDLSEKDVVNPVVGQVMANDYTPLIIDYKNYSIHVSLNGFTDPN